MSIIMEIHVEPHSHDGSDIEKGCFLCWKPLSAPTIHWMGSNGSIFLHPHCVLDLAVRMFRDLHEVETKYGLRLTAYEG